MKHVVRKLFMDYQKEEDYLNEMAAKGLALVDYTFARYVFEETPKGEYIYRIELLENPVKHVESQNYIRFMEESGIEFVSSVYRWVYFRRKAADGAFDIYTDMDSRIRHFRRIRSLSLFGALINLFIGIFNFYYGFFEVSFGIPPFNSYISIVSFTVFTLILIIVILPMTKKITSLEKEKSIRE
ncbi:MAG TPA: DUF2812 domain-containing protein [Clostridia bacterium]|nr:DUF2812 domain-containing protein [Clostridia bacterium]